MRPRLGGCVSRVGKVDATLLVYDQVVAGIEWFTLIAICQQGNFFGCYIDRNHVPFHLASEQLSVAVKHQAVATLRFFEEYFGRANTIWKATEHNSGGWECWRKAGGEATNFRRALVFANRLSLFSLPAGRWGWGRAACAPRVRRAGASRAAPAAAGSAGPCWV